MSCLHECIGFALRLAAAPNFARAESQPTLGANDHLQVPTTFTTTSTNVAFLALHLPLSKSLRRWRVASLRKLRHFSDVCYMSVATQSTPGLRRMRIMVYCSCLTRLTFSDLN